MNDHNLDLVLRLAAKVFFHYTMYKWQWTEEFFRVGSLMVKLENMLNQVYS